ncbi:MAG: DUF4340 domain-containing protein [Bacteroidetes bacterium]|nr:DUF4340 domain-containing protein [Bacteroidota bacterium]MCW5894772.1 DUF4340 domain-containing protein [Bacteroidota bacterium]
MKRNTTILIGIFVLLAVGTYFVLQQEGEQSRASSVGDPLVKYDSASVDKLEIFANTNTVVLEKQAGKWMVTSPFNYPADEAGVTSAVGKGKEMNVTGLISTNPEKQHVYAVDSTGTLVNLFANNNRVASVRIGKPATNWTETYARLEGSDNVYTVSGTLGPTFIKEPDIWRDKTIFKADQSTINEVKFRYPAQRGSADTTFVLVRKDSVNWAIGSDSVGSAVVTFLNYLSSFQTDEFLSSPETTAKDLAAVIEVSGTQLHFYKRSDGKYEVRTSASPHWYSVSEWKAGQVLKRKKEFVQH